MSKRDYFMQKGLQIKRLDEQISSVPTGSSSSREVTKYRELCPPGTSDIQIQKMIGQCKGDAQRIENAISELWEDYRGHDQDDAWATVSKKTTKKKHDYSSQRSYSSQKTHQQLDDQVDAPQDGDAQAPRSSERFSTRGRGSMRGRGMTSSRGGRGGRGGRSRGGAVVSTNSTRVNRSGDNEEESPENDDNFADATNSSNEARVQQSMKANKDSKRDRGARTTTKTTTSQSVTQAPPVVYPVLTGAWTKKLNVTAATTTPKPVEAVPTSTSTPASVAASKSAEKPTTSTTDTEIAGNASKSEKSKPSSPKKKAQQEMKSKKKQKSSTSEPIEETVVVVEQAETVTVVDKVISPAASPKKTVAKNKTETTETTVETSSSTITADWGSLDVSTTTMDEWSSSSAPTDSTEPKKASTPNAWARGSPVISPLASKQNAPAPKSPVVDARPTVLPGSPKDFDAPRSSGSTSTSPRPYLKMGKWDNAATPNLALQFGSFSLSGMDSLEPTSPRGWSSTTTTSTTSNMNSGAKTATKSTTPQSAWGTTTAASPKKTLSPERNEQSRVQEGTTSKAAASVPPGLSVESGRVTPTTGQSPRYAPSAPSPASLPKPDEVKRGTPTRVQGGPFQAQSGTATQTNKMNISYGTGLYQTSYGQYSMDLSRTGAASTPGQLSAGSGTPKSAGARGGAGAQVAAQSPSRNQQPVAQMQQIPLQQQAQQQQIQQQTQQKQIQQQQGQQPQQSQTQHQTAAQLHQQAQAGMQQGYHYAPPPPPGMALPYNPYNYAGYYQGYGYYQNPQFAQYSPRTQYPPRGNIPYGVEGPVPGFSNPPNMPYQDQHMMAQQHEYGGAVPQGFGEINAAYMQQAPMQQQSGHHGHHGHQNGPQSHGKGGSASAVGAGTQQSHSQRGNSGIQSYQNAGGRDHTSPPVPNASAAMTGSYGQHYGWAGNYGAQPVGGWGHMMPQGYQQSPSQQQQQVPQQQPNTHQQSYHQFGNSSAQTGNTSNDVNQARWSGS